MENILKYKRELKMNSLLISLIIGLIAAILDIIPMVIKKLKMIAIISAFSAWTILGIFIPRIELLSISWLNGIVVALLFNFPTMCLIYENEKRGVIPVIITTIVLGCGVGFFSKVFLG
jgi:hypothetical protein